MNQKKKTTPSHSRSSRHSCESLLHLAQLQAEKCELKEAYQTYLQALKLAQRHQDLSSVMEALAGLLRLSAEALDEPLIQKWDLQLDQLMNASPTEIPPMVWYCKGAIARYRGSLRQSQRYFHRYLNQVRETQDGDLPIAKGWLMLATLSQQRGHPKRSLWLAKRLLDEFESKNLRSINGVTALLLGSLYERRGSPAPALKWYQKAHATFLREHNWYYHLYVLYGYARLARMEKNFSQALGYLDLIENAAWGSEFGFLKREIQKERSLIQTESIDLWIDRSKGIIKTQQSQAISVRKQYILLHLLEALCKAHDAHPPEKGQGLSKAQLIETVWKERYRPEAHDNKLYYNINRLRKLIEPDARSPRYLLNWKEGYRLAPELKVKLIGESTRPHQSPTPAQEGGLDPEKN